MRVALSRIVAVVAIGACSCGAREPLQPSTTMPDAGVPTAPALPVDPPPPPPLSLTAGWTPSRCSPAVAVPGAPAGAAPGIPVSVALGDPVLVQVEALRHAGGDSFSWDCGAAELDGNGGVLVHVRSDYCCGYSPENSYVIAPGGAVAATRLDAEPWAFGSGSRSFLVAEGSLTSVARITDSGTTTAVPLPFRSDWPSLDGPSGYGGPYGAWPDGQGGIVVAAAVGEGAGAALAVTHVDGSGRLLYGPVEVDAFDAPPGTWDSASLFAVWTPLMATVDRGGRALLLWTGSARCGGGVNERAGDGVVFARWLDPRGLPLGDAFSLPVHDGDFVYLLHAMPDGPIALGAFRRDATFAWTGELSGGAPEIAPARRWLAATARPALVDTPAGVAVLTEPCEAADSHGAIDIVAADGSSRARIVFPDSTDCADPLRAKRFTVGVDGTIAETRPALDGAPFTCTFALWYGALGSDLQR